MLMIADAVDEVIGVQGDTHGACRGRNVILGVVYGLSGAFALVCCVFHTASVLPDFGKMVLSSVFGSVVSTGGSLA